MNAPVPPRLVLFLKALPGAKIAHQSGYALYGGRWHKITPDKPAPKGAPVAAHPEAGGVHAGAKHFTDEQWAQLKLPPENVNAGSHNAAVDKLKQMSEAGHVTGILGAGYGVNTYGKKQAIIANQLLKLHGSQHQVVSGQKAGEHAAVQGTAGAALAHKDAVLQEAIDHLKADEKQSGMPAGEKAEDAALVSKLESAVAVQPVVTSVADQVMAAGLKVYTAANGDVYVGSAFSDNPKIFTDAQKADAVIAKLKDAGLVGLKSGAFVKVQAAAKAAEPAQPAKDAPKVSSSKDFSVGGVNFVAVKKQSPNGEYWIPSVKETGQEIPHQHYGSIKGMWSDLSQVAKIKGDKFAQSVGVQQPVGAAPGTLTADQLGKLQSIPWFKLKLPDSNTNAKSHNAALAKIEAMAFAGDVAGLQAFVAAKAGSKQTYAKKQALTAQTALAALEVSDGGQTGGAGTPPAAGTYEHNGSTKPIGLKDDASGTLSSAATGWLHGYQWGVDAPDGNVKNPLPSDAVLVELGTYVGKSPVKLYRAVSLDSNDDGKLIESWSRFEKYASDLVQSGAELGQKMKVISKVFDPSDIVVDTTKLPKKFHDANDSGTQAEVVVALGAFKAHMASVRGGGVAAAVPAPPGLPAGWGGAINGVATKPGPGGGIVDKNAAGLGWFAIAHDEGKAAALKGKFFPTQQAAIDALEGAVPVPVAPAPKPTRTTSQVFHNTTKGHSKSWSVSVSGSKLKTEYGKIGGTQQSTVKDLGTPDAAKAAMATLIKQKTSSGYVSKGAGVHVHGAAAAAETGPKDGDTKQGADGTLVFKDGHWHKQGKFELPKLTDLLAAEEAAGGAWDYEPSDPAFNGHPTLMMHAPGGSTVYIAKTDDGYQVGEFDADVNPVGLNDFGSLPDAVAHLKSGAHGGAVPPDSELAKFGDAGWTPGSVPTGWDAIQPPDFSDDKTKWGKVYSDAAVSLLAHMKAGGSLSEYVTAHKTGAKAGGFTVKINGFKLVMTPSTTEARRVKMMAFIKQLQEMKPGKTAKSAAKKVSPPPPAFVDGVQSMDTWTQTGPQAGSNPGGKFRDPDGQEWYCKFPADADTAKSEVLAAKLYGLAGLAGQDAKLVNKGGKIGIASRWQDVSKASSAKALTKVPGVIDGFATDAWLGNWDVVGMGMDNLQIGGDGKAVRVDAGGSLEYRAQGEKKPFGSKVEEIDTLLDSGKNAHSAAVFSGITKADMTASVARVLKISDVAIRAMVNSFGPGDADAKAKLADTLIARKKDLAKRFPAAAKAKKAVVFKPEKLSEPPSFLNWGGSGKSGPSSKEFVNNANDDAVQAIFAAAKTGDLKAIEGLKLPVFDKDTGQQTGMVGALQHPSQHVKGYAQQAINEINYQLNPPKRFRFDGGHPLSALNAAFPAHGGAQSSACAQKVAKFILLGEPGVVKLADVGLPEKITHAEGGGALSASTYAAASKAAFAKMPETQKQAIKGYTGSSYHAMNGSLWSGNPSGAAKAAGEALKTLGHDIQPGTVLSRKISLHGSDLEALLKSQGKILQEPAIMSTSIRPSSWSGNVHLKMHVGPGVKGLWVGHGSAASGGAMSKHAGEDEMILPPGTRLLILGSRTGGKDADGFGGSTSHVVECVILPT
jgi:predicted DNA-binding WGR domain protein